ncbi:MAG: tRNA (adenosine(37)-N6)-dimethylallyltransferase MiaA [Candidatus Colwellbacteria bacterium CG10_big_fil_rev_8_21_14_0_10_42_22]|uniref:tRNA dimethylallyltransferase n=1 Tax=Candidatus Colwellbacteria bacterium CG10_big_fil_rev_8_21_14_0_10_42_22 TaxID=1974540 RepID=A0A2H0VF70_9BACT|nr:MAG: tRNA (adenosine(37)-N6)-dimethylallyltransferase MiaA [Candidatus Colwellbacteria bacterium CG10_big_fil_rev_8_21_14_0_10_42_22]
MRKEPNRKPRVVAIVGPNASGKSEIALELAIKHNGEIISADSRQVYRGLNLTAGKVPGSWQREGLKRKFIYHGIPHYLTDVISPRKRFTVQNFKKKASRAIDDILKHGKLPIIEGGSGFYVDALLHDINIPKVPPNRKLRRELEKLDNEALLRRLTALDAHTAKRIDQNNRRRIIRAIEIVVMTRSPIQGTGLVNYEHSPYDILKIGISYPADELKRKIKKRLRSRLKEGMINEVKSLHRRGLSWRRLEELGLEFRYIAKHLQGKLSLEEMESTLVTQTWQYARRQLTWFKRDKNIIWIDAPAKALPLVRDFLSP